MIEVKNNFYVLSTNKTTYSFRVTKLGYLEHLYYGRRIDSSDMEAFSRKHVFVPGGCVNYNQEVKNFSLEDIKLEMSSYGKGDIREPFIEVVHADGSFTSDFLFERAEIVEGKAEYETLPGSYDENGKVQHLLVVLRDSSYNLTLELHYYIYEDCDVICRSSKLINNSEETVRLNRLMSSQLDFEDSGYIFTSFNGAWGREMQKYDVPVCAGKYVNSSYTGTSSCRANPFVMISKEDTSEEYGDCYGINLIYSGNHYEAIEVSSFGKTRVVTGINPQSFCFVLNKGDVFEAPEAVMTYSDAGFTNMSRQMHKFVREHIVRGKWKKKERPVLLNSWEAAYFDINEDKLVELAKAGRDVGIELFVMDDGWFGKRDDDTSSLGDWYVDENKLPNGLDGLCRKINDLGIDFGIWVEPEMVNVESNLYREHSDWTMEIPGKPHSEGRNQRILDFANPAVVDYMTEELTRVFSSANIAYVKWDMNRNFSDIYSQYLPPEKQGETAHRYVIGLYHIMKTLTERFPDILFEGCASGGNRFDLGILSYFPQIWASDNTDALCRVNMQEGYSYGYPMSAVSAHVSICPNHQTLRTTPLSARFNVASFGVLGYECNLCEMSEGELDEIKKQIDLYKKWRGILQYGEFYRGRTGNIHEWTCVSEDKKNAAGMLMRELFETNAQPMHYKARGLDKDGRYHFYNRETYYDVKEYVNGVAAGFQTPKGEEEEYDINGDALMYRGVKLRYEFAAVIYNHREKYSMDFASRMYFMEGRY